MHQLVSNTFYRFLLVRFVSFFRSNPRNEEWSAFHRSRSYCQHETCKKVKKVTWTSAGLLLWAHSFKHGNCIDYFVHELSREANKKWSKLYGDRLFAWLNAWSHYNNDGRVFLISVDTTKPVACSIQFQLNKGFNFVQTYFFISLCLFHFFWKIDSLR